MLSSLALELICDCCGGRPATLKLGGRVVCAGCAHEAIDRISPPPAPVRSIEERVLARLADRPSPERACSRMTRTEYRETYDRLLAAGRIQVVDHPRRHHQIVVVAGTTGTRRALAA